MQKKQTILVVASLLVVVLSVTLAYFTAQIIGKGKDISVTSTNLQIIFTDSDSSISGTNIEPGWSTTKTFTITNKSNENYKYDIIIKDLINTFVTSDYLQYKITSDNGGYNMTDYSDVPKSETAKDTVLAYSTSINVGVTQNYTIELVYKNDEDIDQSEDMGKTLSGTIFITEGTEQPTIYDTLLSDKTTIKKRTDFTTIEGENTNTLYSETEDGTEIYYFSGFPTDNWVKFGKFATDIYDYLGYSIENGSETTFATMEKCENNSYYTNCTKHYIAHAGDPIYWRIIRTNKDGSIRLIYHANSPQSDRAYVGDSTFNTTDNDPMYVGYMYGTTGSLENNRTNENDSIVKTYVDNWYKENLIDYTKYLSLDAVYCNDRELASGNEYSTTNSFKYASYERIKTNNQPTFNCTNISDAFSVTNEKAKLTYPVGLVTADEVAFSGRVYDTIGYITTNSLKNESTYYYGRKWSWWFMSPSNIYNNAAQNFGAAGPWFPRYLDSAEVSRSLNIRPVISIKKCLKWKTGTGTPIDPYVIDYENSSC